MNPSKYFFLFWVFCNVYRTGIYESLILKKYTSSIRADFRKGWTAPKAFISLMLFCPCCGNLLLIELSGDVQFYCKTCAYRYTLSGQISRSLTLTRKSVDPVLGGETAWQGADKTQNPCPVCAFPDAFWIQMQIRSSDEPMSRFYRCCQCAHQWRED